MNSSEVLLNNAERYGLLVASSVNESMGDDQSAVRQSRSNIGTYVQLLGDRYLEYLQLDGKLDCISYGGDFYSPI